MMENGENSKRKKSTDSEELNSLKKRKTVSPVKSQKFNALDHCRKVCTEFRTDPKHMKYAQFFLTPVDPVALHCPTYFEIIKRPMDLSTIQKKLDNNEYSSEDDFAFDFRLMFENCYTFNGRDHQIAPYCKMFQDAFEEKFSRIKKLKAKSKFTLLDKIRRAKDTIIRDIGKYELILADLKEKLESVKQQEKDEEMRLNQPDDFMPKQKKKSSVKRVKSKPINPFIEINAPKVKNKEPKEKAKKPTTTTTKSKSKPMIKPLQMLELPPPLPTQQTKPDPILKSDSEEDDTAPSMTYEEMRNLSAAINLLPAEKVIEILDIIKKYQPKEAEAGEDELEIEFQNLKPVTLRALEKFIKDFNKPKPAPKPQSRGKTMQIEDAKELEKQRQEIQNQLNSIDDQLGMAPKKKPPPPPPPSPKNDNSSSSDSDSDDSSSSSDPSSETLASSSSDSE